MFQKIIKKILDKITFTNILKAIGTAIILLVVGMLAFRLYTLNHYPDFARGILPTDTLKSAYADGSLAAITWEPAVEYDENGDYFVHQAIYFPEAKTLIITVRYNDSLLEELHHEGGGDTLQMDVSLYADGTERVHPLTYSYNYAYGIYSYRRYVFEGVELSDYEYLYLDIYHDEPDYNTAPYSSIEFYGATTPTSAYKLTSADKKALK